MTTLGGANKMSEPMKIKLQRGLTINHMPLAHLKMAHWLLARAESHRRCEFIDLARWRRNPLQDLYMRLRATARAGDRASEVSIERVKLKRPGADDSKELSS